MSTFCAKIGEFSYFLWNSSKSPPFWINPTVPHPQKSVPPFGPKIPQNGKIPPFWPHWLNYGWIGWIGQPPKSVSDRSIFRLFCNRLVNFGLYIWLHSQLNDTIEIGNKIGQVKIDWNDEQFVKMEWWRWGIFQMKIHLCMPKISFIAKKRIQK